MQCYMNSTLQCLANIPWSQETDFNDDFLNGCICICFTWRLFQFHISCDFDQTSFLTDLYSSWFESWTTWLTSNVCFSFAVFFISSFIPCFTTEFFSLMKEMKKRDSDVPINPVKFKKQISVLGFRFSTSEYDRDFIDWKLVKALSLFSHFTFWIDEIACSAESHYLKPAHLHWRFKKKASVDTC